MSSSNSPVFERLDNNSIPRGGEIECRAVINVFNENLRLPWLLEYYRKLGVARFFMVDNCSTDGSTEFLLAQKDCHIFRTAAAMREAGQGSAWHQAIIDEHGENHWWVLADADEMLVYPSSETVPLPQFCRYLDAIGAEGVSAFMIDMYSEGPIATAHYKPGQPFTEVCPFFDSEYDFWPKPRHRQLYRESGHSIWRTRNGRAPLLFPLMEPFGGPRIRIMHPEFYRAGPFKIFKMKAYRQLRPKLNRLGFKADFMLMPSVLFKVPLIKAGRGTKILDSHNVTPIRLAPVTGALLHFKFFSDFHQRVVAAIARGQHFNGAVEYGRYSRLLKGNPNVSFHYAKSAKYAGSHQLAALGLIKDDPSFDAWLKGKEPATSCLTTTNKPLPRL
jgi:hypothetical protein